jgi:biopolymer transport protein ExbD
MAGTRQIKRAKRRSDSLNVVPILDIVFILIFFLLTSSHFVQIFNVGGDLPVFSEKKQDNQDKKSLNLRLEIHKSRINVYTGSPGGLVKKFDITSNDYTNALQNLNLFLVELKNSWPTDNFCILEPEDNIPHQFIVDVMDSVREYKGADNANMPLFNQLIFGNL